MYIFSSESEEDNSKFELKIETKDMLSIEAHDNSCITEGYTFRVELKEKIHFFACGSATECQKWIEILQKSKKTSEELKRTKFNCLKRNVDPLIHSYRFLDLNINEKIKEDMDQFLEEIDIEKSTAEDFVESYTKALDFLDYTLDALQCQRPFYQDLFKAYLQSYHLELTNFVAKFWNARFKSFSGGNVLIFVH